MDPSLVSTGEIGTWGENSEAFEGVLVRVTGTCDNDDFGYGEWSLDDGSGPVRVDDFIYNEFMPVLGTSYQVTGILYYSYGEFKILPRDENDIVEILSVDKRKRFLKGSVTFPDIMYLPQTIDNEKRNKERGSHQGPPLYRDMF